MDIEKGPLSLAVRLGDSGKLTLAEWGECIHVGRWGGLEQKWMYLALDARYSPHSSEDQGFLAGGTCQQQMRNEQPCLSLTNKSTPGSQPRMTHWRDPWGTVAV